jgi:hypothetical protein
VLFVGVRQWLGELFRLERLGGYGLRRKLLLVMLLTATLVVNHDAVLVIALVVSNSRLLNVLALDLVCGLRLRIDDPSSRIVLLARGRLRGRRDALLVLTSSSLDLAHIVRVRDESKASCSSSTAACCRLDNLSDSFFLLGKGQSVHVLLCS